MADEEGEPVDLYIYDLTKGLASLLSPTILGRQVEGVWHTGVVVFGREYFYGGAGVTSCQPGSTSLGAPYQVERLGTTFVPFPVFEEYVRGLATTAYTGAAYRLLEHNCNHFSDEVAQFACGARVPKHIVAQPERDLPPPLRLALQAALDRLAAAGAPVAGPRRARRDSPDYLTLNDQIEEARAASQQLDARRSTLAEKLARKERRREKKRRKQRAGEPADNGEGEPDAEDGEGETDAMTEAAAAPVELEERAGPSAPGDEPRPRDPPILFKDIDGAAEYEALMKALEGAALSEEELRSADELRQYLVAGEGSWVLGDEFLGFAGRVLSDEALAGARVALLRCLAAAALRDDVALLLHQDRRHHALLSYAHGVDRLPDDEQLALALFMANLFSCPSSAEWLLYISEWGAGALSNIRVTTKVCVHGVLGAGALRDAGTALLYNIAAKEVKTVRLSCGGALRRRLPQAATFKVFDEVCVELCMAALQLCSSAPPEELLWRALAALARLAQHSHDVPQLVALVGPDPAAFRGTSPRVDEQVDLIAQRLAARG